MEEKNDRLSQEIPMEATDDAVLERLWADQPGAVSWKRKSPFGQPVTAAAPIPPAVPAAPQVETVPEPSAPVEAAPLAAEELQPPVEAAGDEKEPWPLEGATVTWKRKSPFGQPVTAAAPIPPAVPAAPRVETVPEQPAPVQAAPTVVQPPEPVMKTEVKPAKQGGLWGIKSRTPVIGGAVPGGVFGSVDSRRTEKERPASLWGKEKEPAAGKEYGRASGSVWGKHTGQGSKTPAAGGTTWGKKAPSAGQICPQCGTPNPADARFCCMCRASLQEKTCPSCGKVIALAQARYCPFCGADL